jgi:hypothetical protein
MRQAFPDLQITIEEQIAEGDKVLTRFRTRGTHRGELWGIPCHRQGGADNEHEHVSHRGGQDGRGVARPLPTGHDAAARSHRPAVRVAGQPSLRG